MERAVKVVPGMKKNSHTKDNMALRGDSEFKDFVKENETPEETRKRMIKEIDESMAKTKELLGIESR